MTTPSLSESCFLARYELYEHDADTGIRGFGATPAEAFEAAALALTSAICSPAEVLPTQCVELHCQGVDLEDLFYEWINTVI